MKSNSNVSGCSLRGILVVAGGILVHLSIGSYYTFGKSMFDSWSLPFFLLYCSNTQNKMGVYNVTRLEDPAIEFRH